MHWVHVHTCGYMCIHVGTCTLQQTFIHCAYACKHFLNPCTKGSTCIYMYVHVATIKMLSKCGMNVMSESVCTYICPFLFKTTECVYTLASTYNAQTQIHCYSSDCLKLLTHSELLISSTGSSFVSKTYPFVYACVCVCVRVWVCVCVSPKMQTKYELNMMRL